MSRNRQGAGKRRRKKHNKRTWFISRVAVTALFLLGSMAILINGCFFLGTIWLKSDKSDISQAGIIQNYKSKKKASSQGNSYNEKKSETDKKKGSDGKTDNAKEETDYPSLCELPKVDKPKERSSFEILKRLEELSKDSEIIARIYKNKELYPEKLLEALANNPEMADFTEKYLSNNGTVSSSLTAFEQKQKYPLFLQWDPRWGYAEYGDSSCIGLSGCGPTCLSMVLYYLTGDTALTPDKIAAYSSENGYYVQGTGTAWALLEDLPSLYHINVRQLSLSEEGMKAELDMGHMIICVMGPGDFTAAGHFIVVYGYDKDGFMVNDPNCVARSRKRWKFEEIEKQIKNLWTYWEGAGTEVEAVEY